MIARTILAVFGILLAASAALADPSPLVSGDPLTCFNRIDGAGNADHCRRHRHALLRAIHVKTEAVAATANAWDIRPRCFSTLARNRTMWSPSTFWMRTIASPAGRGFTSFVLERNDSPYTKSVTYTAVRRPGVEKIRGPLHHGGDLRGQCVQLQFLGDLTQSGNRNRRHQHHGLWPGRCFSELGLTTWPYAERAADAPWRAAAADRIERYRKGDIAVSCGMMPASPSPAPQVHVKMKRHAFGFGTAVAGDIIQSCVCRRTEISRWLKKLFNKVVTENVLKWPPFESWGTRTGRLHAALVRR